MKEIRRTVTTTSIITEYEAMDGRVFANKEDCVKWENDDKNKIAERFKKIPQFKINGSESYLASAFEEDNVLVIAPRDFEDISVINSYAQMNFGPYIKSFTSDCIGKIILVNLGYEEDCFYWYRMDNYLIEIKRAYDNYKNKINDLIKAKGND